MQFKVLSQALAFEIDDELWRESGAAAFCVTMPAYVFPANPDLDVRLVPVSMVYAPVRDPGVIGLDPNRLLPVLKRFVSGDPVYAIRAQERPGATDYPLEVCDGYHRFYASIALGFTHLPLQVRPYFNMADL